MNKYILYGGAAIAVLAGVLVVRNMGSSVPAQDSGTTGPQTPLLFSTGLGTQAIPSSDTQGATSDVNSQLSNLAGVLSTNSHNDMTVNLAQIGSNKDVSLASIANNNDLGKASLNASFLDTFMHNLSGLAKAGISQITGGNGIGAGIVYSDPSKNLSYATGYDALGNLIGAKVGGGPMLLGSSAQQQYDSTTAITKSGSIVTANINLPGAPSTLLGPVPKPPRQYDPGPRGNPRDHDSSQKLWNAW